MRQPSVAPHTGRASLPTAADAHRARPYTRTHPVGAPSAPSHHCPPTPHVRAVVGADFLNAAGTVAGPGSKLAGLSSSRRVAGQARASGGWLHAAGWNNGTAAGLVSLLLVAAAHGSCYFFPASSAEAPGAGGSSSKRPIYARSAPSHHIAPPHHSYIQSSCQEQASFQLQLPVTAWMETSATTKAARPSRPPEKHSRLPRARCSGVAWWGAAARAAARALIAREVLAGGQLLAVAD